MTLHRASAAGQSLRGPRTRPDHLRALPRRSGHLGIRWPREGPRRSVRQRTESCTAQHRRGIATLGRMTFFDGQVIDRELLVWTVATRRQLDRWEAAVSEIVSSGTKQQSPAARLVW